MQLGCKIQARSSQTYTDGQPDLELYSLLRRFKDISSLTWVKIFIDFAGISTRAHLLESRTTFATGYTLCQKRGLKDTSVSCVS